MHKIEQLEISNLLNSSLQLQYDGVYGIANYSEIFKK